jgi:hypothetical protein
MDRQTEFYYLRDASIAARGLWLDISTITVLQSENGSLPIDREQLARVAGVDRARVDSLVAELAKCGVLEVGADGTISSDTLAAKVSHRKAGEKIAESRRRRKQRLIEAFNGDMERL